MFVILIALVSILRIPDSYYGVHTDYSVVKDENKVQTEFTASGDDNYIDYSVMYKRMFPSEDDVVRAKEIVTKPVTSVTKTPKIECHYIEFISYDKNGVVSKFRRFMPYSLLNYEHNWFTSFFM